jgi:DNA polymerase-1
MILLIDGNNMAAIANAATTLSTKAGFPTQAIYGFARSLHAAVRTLGPDKVIVCWDGGRSKVRKETHPEYKALRAEGRKKDEEQERRYKDLIRQMPFVQMVAALTGCVSVRGRGTEADDLIALFVKKYKEKDDVIIVSTDKDFYQLVDRRVTVFNPVSHKRITWGNFKEVTGLETPAQFLEMRMITGEGGPTSDNIPGVKGVGEATAKRILLREGSLQAFFEMKVPTNKREEAVLRNEELVRRNRILMDLSNPAAYIAGPPTVTAKKPQKELLKKLFGRFEITSLLVRIESFTAPFIGERIKEDIDVD